MKTSTVHAMTYWSVSLNGKQSRDPYLAYGPCTMRVLAQSSRNAEIIARERFHAWG